MVNIGTLLAFVMVSIGIIVLRRRRPDLPRAFRVPGVPVVPILSALICFYLMLNLQVETWIRFVVWMLIGLVIYFSYSRRHAKLNDAEITHDIDNQLAHAVERQYVEPGRTSTRHER